MSPFGARQNEGEAMTDKQRGQALSGMQRDLGGGLILRRARREDAEAVAAFNARGGISPPVGRSSSEDPSEASRPPLAT